MEKPTRIDSVQRIEPFPHLARIEKQLAFRRRLQEMRALLPPDTGDVEIVCALITDDGGNDDNVG